MAKVPFGKLDFKNTLKPITVEWRGVEIEIKQYLPMEDKAEFLQYLLETTIDPATNSSSPIRFEIYYNLGLVQWYCNIVMTDKQKEDLYKLYDMMQTSGFFAVVQNNIPETEARDMYMLAQKTVKSFEKYANSFAGTMTSISSDANNLGAQIDDMLSKVRDKEGLEELAVIKDAI